MGCNRFRFQVARWCQSWTSSHNTGHKKALNDGLWNLLGGDRTKKAASQMSADTSKLKEIGEAVKGVVKLGHEVKGVVKVGHEASNSRGTERRPDPVLEKLVPLLFHCFIN